MLRATRMSLACLVACSGVADLSTEARAGEVVARVGGPVAGLAVTGDAVVLARQPDGRQLVVERHGLGLDRSVRVLGRVPAASEPQQVALAASDGGVALGTQEGSSDGDVGGRTQAFGGGPQGPLRALDGCPSGLLRPSVAALGAEIAYTTGGCIDPSLATVSPVGVVRIPATAAAPAGPGTQVSDGGVTGTLALTPTATYAGVFDPALLAGVVGRLVRVGTEGAAARVPIAPGTLVAPLGALADGRLLVAVSGSPRPMVDGELDEAAVDEPCESTLALLGPAGPPTRVAVEGSGSSCLRDAGEDESGEDETGFGLAAATGDRIAALRTRDRRPGSELVTTVTDGGTPRVLARGDGREPRAVAAAAGRVAWTREGCDGRTEVLLAAAGPGADAAEARDCDLLVRTRSARRAADGRVRLRLRCPRGCSGTVVDLDAKRMRTRRTFSFAPGRHRLDVLTSRCAARLGRVRLAFDLAGADAQRVTVRLRRR